MRLGQPRARARSRRNGGDGGQRRRRLRWRGRVAVRLTAAASAPLHGRGTVWAGVRACPDSAAPLCRCGTEEQDLILAQERALHCGRGYLLARAVGVAVGRARGRGDEPGRRQRLHVQVNVRVDDGRRLAVGRNGAHVLPNARALPARAPQRPQDT
jgi:hypothetical protein